MHSVETDAESLFAAAHEAVRQWSMLWWFSSEALIEVRSGEHRWHVQAQL
jgi:hypothetical protein